MSLWAIDPGPVQCGRVILTNNGTIHADVISIDDLLSEIDDEPQATDPIAVEWIEGFGLRVGSEVFETVYNIGRIAECAGSLRVHRVTRKQVKIALVGHARANDADVRLAICEMYGGKAKAIGTRKAPGPLYRVKGHCWSALAVALTWKMQHEGASQIEIAVSGS